MSKNAKWDDISDTMLNHKYPGDYITISKYGRFSMKAQTIYRHKEFNMCDHVDIRYSKSQKALLFFFNKEKRGIKITPHKNNPKIVIFGSLYFFSRMDLTELLKITKKYTVVKEKIADIGYALILYLERNTAKEIII